MFGVAATSGKIGRRAFGRSFRQGRDSLPRRALPCLGHAAAGQLEAVQLRAAHFKASQAPSGACGTRSVRTGSERYCKALIVGVSPAAAVVIFSSASNPGLTMRTWLHRRPAAGGTRGVAEVPGPVAPEDRLRPASHPLCWA